MHNEQMQQPECKKVESTNGQISKRISAREIPTQCNGELVVTFQL